MFTGFSTILDLHTGDEYYTTASIDLSPGLIVAGSDTAITKLYGNLGCNIELNTSTLLWSFFVVCGGCFDDPSLKPTYPAGSLIRLGGLSPGDVFWGRVDGTTITRGTYMTGSDTYPGRVKANPTFQWPLIALTDQLDSVTDSFVKLMVI